MAHGKETPRQKMIGMMYLVLTALLALNVSKDILDAFVIVNEGIMKTTENFSAKNEIIYNNFQVANLNNPEKVKPYLDKAMKAKKMSEDMINEIKRVKSLTLAYTEFGLKDEQTLSICDTLSLEMISAKDNYDKPMNILLGGEGNGDGITGDGEGYKLKKSLDTYRDDMLNLLDEKDRKLVKWSIFTDDMPHAGSEGQIKPWAFANFYHTVLAADVAILNKLIADIKNAEADIVAQLYSAIDAGDFKFDQIAAKVVPKSSYIISGDKYEADIFVAAYSTTENPEIIVGSNVDTVNLTVGGTPTSVEAVNGVGKYQVGASGEGERKYGGLIKVKAPDGSVKAYPFKGEYIVARPSATISPTKMNVFYTGVDNPVSISVPGVPSENIIPSITGGGTIRPSGQKGEYIVKVTTQGTCKVNVSAKIGGTTRSMGAMDFRIKRVPDPRAVVAGQSEGNIAKNILTAQQGVIAKLENFDFDLRFDVTSFDMVLTVGNMAAIESSPNARFTSKMTDLMNRAQRGQKIIFEKIRAKGPDGTTRQLNTIVFTVQ